jgi:hypothetical protein
MRALHETREVAFTRKQPEVLRSSLPLPESTLPTLDLVSVPANARDRERRNSYWTLADLAQFIVGSLLLGVLIPPVNCCDCY